MGHNQKPQSCQHQIIIDAAAPKTATNTQSQNVCKSSQQRFRRPWLVFSSIHRRFQYTHKHYRRTFWGQIRCGSIVAKNSHAAKEKQGSWRERDTRQLCTKGIRKKHEPHWLERDAERGKGGGVRL